MVNNFARGQDSRAAYYLSSVPTKIMTAILQGNLPSRRQEPVFDEKWGEHLQSTEDLGALIFQIVRKDTRKSSQIWNSVSP
jgi:hypothetical protein